MSEYEIPELEEEESLSASKAKHFALNSAAQNIVGSTVSALASSAGLPVPAISLVGSIATVAVKELISELEEDNDRDILTRLSDAMNSESVQEKAKEVAIEAAKDAAIQAAMLALAAGGAPVVVIIPATIIAGVVVDGIVSAVESALKEENIDLNLKEEQVSHAVQNAGETIKETFDSIANLRGGVGESKESAEHDKHGFADRIKEQRLHQPKEEDHSH